MTYGAHLPHGSCVRESWGWRRTGCGCCLQAAAGTHSLFLSLYFCVELTFSIINAKKCFHPYILAWGFFSLRPFCLACSERIPTGGITGSGSFMISSPPLDMCWQVKSPQDDEDSVLSMGYPGSLCGNRADTHLIPHIMRSLNIKLTWHSALDHSAFPGLICSETGRTGHFQR